MKQNCRSNIEPVDKQNDFDRIIRGQQPASSINTSSPGKARWLSLFKAIAYLAFALIGGLLVTVISKSIFHASLLELTQKSLELQVVRAALLFIGVVLFPTVMMLKLAKEPFLLSGWQDAAKLKMLFCGMLSGTLLLTMMALIIWINGNLVLSYNAMPVPRVIYSCLLSAILWLLLAAGEEGLHRGYAFIQASRGVSFWIAALISSIWFMWGHVNNQGETALGILATGLVALVLSYSLFKTGSLWFALGFHAAWNFTQSYLFGFANSGSHTPISLFTAKLTGSGYLSGESVGPEGSILVLPAIVVLAIIVSYVNLAAKDKDRNSLFNSVKV